MHGDGMMSTVNPPGNDAETRDVGGGVSTHYRVSVPIVLPSGDTLCQAPPLLPGVDDRCQAGFYQCTIDTGNIGTIVIR